MNNITEKEIMKNWQGDITNPLVSIRCTTYNHEKYIEQCLNGLLMQKTNFPFRIIVHDDASTDKTSEIINEYEIKFPNIISPIYQKENLYSKNRYELGKIIDSYMMGKYIATCEGDDYWTDPMKLQLQYDAMEKNLDCSLCFHKVKFVDQYGIEEYGTAPSPKADFREKINLGDYCREEYGNLRWAMHTSSLFYRQKDKDTDKRLDQFPWGDMRLILSLLMKGEAIFIDREMSCYRTLSGGYNSKILKDNSFAISEEEKVIKALKSFDEASCKKYHVDVENRIRSEEFKLDTFKKNIIPILFDRKYNHIASRKMRMGTVVKIINPDIYKILRKKIHRK